jgi:hypothetical protein
MRWHGPWLSVKAGITELWWLRPGIVENLVMQLALGDDEPAIVRVLLFLSFLI